MTDKLQDTIEEFTGGSAVKHIAFADTPYQMKAYDNNLIVNSASGAVVVTLPPMSEAAGKYYYIEAPVGATADVSVNIKETATEISTYGDMDADDDHAIFFCTGKAWRVVLDGVA